MSGEPEHAPPLCFLAVSVRSAGWIRCVLLRRIHFGPPWSGGWGCMNGNQGRSLVLSSEWSASSSAPWTGMC